MMQTVVVIVVLVACVAFVVNGLRNTLSGKSTPCDGCPLKDKCNPNKQKHCERQNNHKNICTCHG